MMLTLINFLLQLFGQIDVNMANVPQLYVQLPNVLLVVFSLLL